MEYLPSLSILGLGLARGILSPMTLKRTPRPRDPIQLGKLMVDIATGQVPDGVDGPKEKRARTGGAKGGPARAALLTAEQRSEIARTAAAARWKKT